MNDHCPNVVDVNWFDSVHRELPNVCVQCQRVFPNLYHCQCCSHRKLKKQMGKNQWIDEHVITLKATHLFWWHLQVLELFRNVLQVQYLCHRPNQQQHRPNHIHDIPNVSNQLPITQEFLYDFLASNNLNMQKFLKKKNHKKKDHNLNAKQVKMFK